jgi:hypothetical protein
MPLDSALFASVFAVMHDDVVLLLLLTTPALALTLH